jgi:hypothetical protein
MGDLLDQIPVVGLVAHTSLTLRSRNNLQPERVSKIFYSGFKYKLLTTSYINFMGKKERKVQLD